MCTVCSDDIVIVATASLYKNNAELHTPGKGLLVVVILVSQYNSLFLCLSTEPGTSSDHVFA